MACPLSLAYVYDGRWVMFLYAINIDISLRCMCQINIYEDNSVRILNKGG